MQPILYRLNAEWYDSVRQGGPHPNDKASIWAEADKFVEWVKKRPRAYYPVPLALSRILCKTNSSLLPGYYDDG